MNKLEELLAQRAAVDAAIAAETTKGRLDALANVRTLCKQFGITLREVKPYVLDRKPRGGKATAAVAKPRVIRKAAIKKSPIKNI
jgi:hypothetical protein